ncbi:hypothetical protein APUTEX25_003188 [Auxenochlorella protothecoides]|uniref:Uncharacterized protein n=1 Tax=Auxenochlorella protothecoides TaxID=3075 RepID=A0A3M7KUX0_AUXPR|nr:hypothetical protein APUTEX25_003188 [Auxenochlorella protothecoides]|eukprot:RMZ53654.1 hypothetical protein APUTEX25_003188 [Auxenochlorella protothecoides]
MGALPPEAQQSAVQALLSRMTPQERHQARIAELPRAAQAGAVVRLLQQQQASQRAQQKAEHDTGAGMYMGLRGEGGCCCRSEAVAESATVACSSKFFALPTIQASGYHGGVGTTESYPNIQRLWYFPFSINVLRLDAEVPCTTCEWLTILECVPHGREPCLADVNFNVGAKNTGSLNIGTGNTGTHNLGKCWWKSNNNRGGNNVGSNNTGNFIFCNNMKTSAVQCKKSSLLTSETLTPTAAQEENPAASSKEASTAP